MTRIPTDRAAALVREFEGFRGTAYLCPAGVWTIGYGHTLAVREGQTCTKRQADLWLMEDLGVAAKSLERRIGADVVAELTDGQHDALCDFVFNLGPLKPDAGIWKLLRARNFDAIPAKLSQYVYAGKTKLNGLVRRRNAEIELWSLNEPGSSWEPVPSSATLRAVETPASPHEKAPNTPIITAAVSAVAGVPVAAKQVTDAIAPYQHASPWVGNAVAIVASVAAAAAVALLVLHWLQRKRAKS